MSARTLGRQVYGAMALTACAVLVLQIALSRLLSVTVSAHGAFLVVGIAMIGLASSAVSVFVQRSGDGTRRLTPSLAAFRGAALGLAALCAFTWLGALFPTWGALNPARVVVGAAVFFWTFHYGGWVVADLLSQYAASIGKLYWADLSGAALGCIVAVALLSRLPAPSVIALCCACFAGSGKLLATRRAEHRLNTGAIFVCMTLGLAATLLPALLPLGSAKGQLEERVLWSRWNNLARVTVSERTANELDGADAASRARWAISWGLSPRYDGFAPQSLSLALDSNACTPMIRGGADANLEVLRWDITSLGQHLKQDELERAFVLGGGAGRDVLAMLHFGARHVEVAEINPDVVEAVRGRFHSWSKDPYGDSRVQYSIGEGRNVLERSEGGYDLIQMSMIDTWAASMAGSMVLSEHTLYTIDAFDLYLDRLSPNGMLSISRWYRSQDYGEVARLVSMLGSALRRRGIKSPEDHIAIAHVFGGDNTKLVDVATVVTSLEPLQPSQKKTLGALNRQMGFGVLWPKTDITEDAPFDIEKVVRGVPEALVHSVYDLSDATDDRPFFFNVRRPLASWINAFSHGNTEYGSRATTMIGCALLLVLFAGFILVILPMRRIRKARNIAPPPVSLSIYFAAIGVGFMCLEIALIQRYILFLGHPTYALSVTLLTLLTAAGFGSFLADRTRPKQLTLSSIAAGIVAITLLTAFVVPSITEAALGQKLAARIVIAAVLVAPLGLLLGMMLPIGISRLGDIDRAELVPWMWAINGLAGVIASICGMFLAMELGYGAVLLAGALAYATAWLAFFLNSRRRPPFTPATPR